MHETGVTKIIFETVLDFAEKNNAQKVVSVFLDIGEMSDLQESWMQKFFDYFSKDTVAEGAKLVITWKPIILNCEKCRRNYRYHLKEIKSAECTRCGNKTLRMVSGKEYIIRAIEVL